MMSILVSDEITCQWQRKCEMVFKVFVKFNRQSDVEIVPKWCTDSMCTVLGKKIWVTTGSDEVTWNLCVCLCMRVICL